MGIEIRQFLDKSLNPKLICGLCDDVLEEPKMLKPCGHMFCKKCLQEEWSNTPNWCLWCPNEECGKPKTKAIKEVPDDVVIQLNKLVLECPHYCGKKIKLGDLAQHRNECKEGWEFCNKDCGAKLWLPDMEGHNCMVFLKEKLSKMKKQRDKAREQRDEFREEAREDRIREANEPYLGYYQMPHEIDGMSESEPELSNIDSDSDDEDVPPSKRSRLTNSDLEDTIESE